MSIRGNWSEGWSSYNSKDVSPNEIIITNVRLESAAGWYIGSLEFYNFDEIDFYSRDTEYFPSESFLLSYYPESISIEDAINKINNDSLYKRRMERKLGKI